MLYVESQLLHTSYHVKWPLTPDKNNYIWFSPNTPTPFIDTASTTTIPTNCVNTIDNTKNLDYCLVEFAGEVQDVVDWSTNTWNIVFTSYQLEVWVWGEPFYARDKSYTNLTVLSFSDYPLGKQDAWQAQALCSIGEVPSTSLPPYFGYIRNGGFKTPSGFFITDELAFTPPIEGTKFHMVLPLGRMLNQELSISGYRKIYLALRCRTPTIIDQSKPPGPGIPGIPWPKVYVETKLVAHLYEAREKIRVVR